MKKLLVVVDMQNDFIDGSLGTPEAQAIVPKVVDKIRNWDGAVWCTADEHDEDTYLSTKEGQKLPVLHCIDGTHGWLIQQDVFDALEKKESVYLTTKHTFGDAELAMELRNLGFDYIELVGLCTDICVVSNAMLIKSMLPDADIAVDANCCAGSAPEMHKAALQVMNSCQIEIIRGR